MKAFERSANFTYLRMTTMSANCSREDTERKINSGHILANFFSYISVSHLKTRNWNTVYLPIYISNKMQTYTVYLYLETALHVSGSVSTHHQEHIQLYLQHVFIPSHTFY